MDRYQVLSKMCLNNWHYINEKLLSFHDDINFFTGHSGSGKSTVLDALQIVLYADTNGRGFFNKAAKEDSDRSLIEYLRGMKVVQENNEISYLRNKNFSTTIVLEFRDTQTNHYQCIGVVFDVDVSVNDVSRMFFWHTGELPENRYRNGDKVFTISELKEYLQQNYSKEDYYLSRTNEKFRNELYSNYFGGLHPKHFPALFKKAIPFKMDMKLEDFVKNYICTENDIHMEDMQDSVAQYTRLKRRLEDTKKEISLLTEIKEQYGRYQEQAAQIEKYQYFLNKLEMKAIESRMEQLQSQSAAYEEDISQLQNTVADLEENIKVLQEQRDEVVVAIQNSGYEHLETELKSLGQLLEYLYRSKAEYDKAAHRLESWLTAERLDSVQAEVIERFRYYRADLKDIRNLKACLSNLKYKLEQEKSELTGKINELKYKLSDLSKEMDKLRNGQKAYPDYLLEAKDYLTRELEQIYEIPIRVDILADVIEVKNDYWRNAIEGYMGGNKLNLMVAPAYAKSAMELYKKLDSKKYHKVAVIDTERVLQNARPPLAGSLAEEVESEHDYIKAYCDYLMGALIKCATIEELRNNKSGITADCILYQGFKLQHINPRSYTADAYIGRNAVIRRLQLLEEHKKELLVRKDPLDLQYRKIEEILGFEYLQQDTEHYEELLSQLQQIPAKEQQSKELQNKINELKMLNVDEWKARKALLDQLIASKGKERDKAAADLISKEKAVEDYKAELITLNEALIEMSKVLTIDSDLEDLFQSFMREQGEKKLDTIRHELAAKKDESEYQMSLQYECLLKKREFYHSAYAYRGFSISSKDNTEYDQLLETLSSDKLGEFSQKAHEQAVKAIHHFKTDFIYKIRDAIKEVMQQKDDLNRILAQMDFGKDKYRFIITKNKGEDGKFFDMFMDENLEINPHQLTGNMSNQLDIFSMQHEKDYSELINELLELFMPPENSDPKALEEARANMEKYSDYRTYLSFDMEQLVEGMPPMRLSRMLSKNSGGEGQNPLYVALLASFAQVYRINLKANIRRRPTPRLVVLDEAFSKMDAEKVGSCIGLIRKLGFQAIISATNDKIQNYVDNVDKTFVFANPNKNRISVQEFEKREFDGLLASREDEDEAD